MAKSDLMTLLSVIAVGIVFLWLLVWRVNIEKEFDEAEEDFQDTLENNEKKKDG